MGWALLWAVIIGGATNSGWVGFFVFLLVLMYQEHNRYEKVIINLQRKVDDYESEIAALKNAQPAQRRWEPGDPIITSPDQW